MQVYVLVLLIEYEGEYVLGAYASSAEAQAAADVYAAEYSTVDGLAVYEQTLGAPAAFGQSPVLLY